MIERERKFIGLPKLTSEDAYLFADKVEYIKQTYISTYPAEVRIRATREIKNRWKERTPGVVFEQTIKIGDDVLLGREEYTTTHENQKYLEELFLLVSHANGQIDKYRYTLGRWEINVYRRKRLEGLILAEIEVDNPSEDIEKQLDVLGIYLHRSSILEVTPYVAYKNSSLVGWEREDVDPLLVTLREKMELLSEVNY